MSSLRDSYERIIRVDDKMSYGISASINRADRVNGALLIGNAFGRNSTDGNVTLWDSNSDLVRLTSAVELFINSTNVADVGINVVATVILADYSRMNVIATLNGRNQVTLGTTGILIQDLTVLGPTTPLGDIYAAPSTTLTNGVPDDDQIQSRIIAGKNVTHNGFLLVPKGWVSISVQNRANTNSVSKVARVSNVVTQPNGVPIDAVEYSIALNPLSYSFPVPVAFNQFNDQVVAPFGEGTFIEIKAEVSSNDTDVFVGGDFLLARKEMFNLQGA